MYFNPYSNQNFFGFFQIFFARFFAFFTGKLSFEKLVADEIQLIVLILISVTCALVGTFLVLRRMTMLANALSHTILLGIVVAYLMCQSLTLPILMIAAFATAIATTFFTEFLHRVIKLQEDASIGLVFSIFFALGILLLTFFSRNVHLGTELVMGNADALQPSNIKLAAFILGINTILFLFFYYGFKITTFDPYLAKIFGFSPIFFNYLLMIQTSITAIGAFQAVGVLMVMAFFVLPPLTARILTNRLPVLLILSAAIGSFASFIGVALSRHILTFFGIGLSTGGIVVIVLGLFYLGAIVINWCLKYSVVDFSKKSKYHRSSEISLLKK